MTITRETRKAGPYVGDGLIRSYPFFFKVFEETDIAVYKGDGVGADVQLTYGSDFFVGLNADQEVSPGGVVTLSYPLEVGKKITIVSEAPYLQETNLTNQGNFYPKVINDAFDKTVVLIQQVREKISRSVTIPWNSEESPGEFLAEYEKRMLGHVEHVDAVKKKIDADKQEAQRFLDTSQEYLETSREEVDGIVAYAHDETNKIISSASNKAGEMSTLYETFRNDLDRILQAVKDLPQHNNLNHAFFGFRITDDLQLVVERSEKGDVFNTDEYLYCTVLPVSAQFEMVGGVLYLILPFSEDPSEDQDASPDEGDEETKDNTEGEGTEEDKETEGGDEVEGGDETGDGNEGDGETGGESGGDSESGDGIQIWNT